MKTLLSIPLDIAMLGWLFTEVVVKWNRPESVWLVKSNEVTLKTPQSICEEVEFFKSVTSPENSN